MLPASWRAMRGIAADERGFSALLTALAATVLMGFAGLAVDVGMWESNRSKMQGAADQAAFSAATTWSRAEGSAAAIATAQGVATQMGFNGGSTNCQTNPTTQIRVCINNPPSTGPFTSNKNGWEVIISGRQQMYFAQFFLSSAPTAAARAVAIPTPRGATACVLALADYAGAATSDVQNALQFDQNVQLPDHNCGVASDSSDTANALNLLNNGLINGPVNVVGQWYQANGAVFGGFPTLENAPPIADPYSGVTVPSAASLPPCDNTQNTSPANGQTVNLTAPGGAVHFCHGIIFGNQATVNLGPGTYYIDNGISLGSNDILQGTGVTVILTDNNPITMKPMNINQGTSITLTAPTSGTYAGLALMSLNTDTSVTQDFKNNATLNVTGAVYFPHNALEFENNVNQPGGCTQYIGRTVYFKNNATIDDQCAGTGTKPILMSGGPTLAE